MSGSAPPPVPPVRLTPARCRQARALLGWTVARLAAMAGLTAPTVLRFERGERVTPATAQGLHAAIEAAGVELVRDGAGVRRGSAPG